ncbi:MAG: hypothetical protein AAGA77_04565 [Bacteroidota bacterium]
MGHFKYIVLVILFCVIVSCEKYEGNPDRFATYDRLMAGMDLSCPEGEADMFLKAIINDRELCYLQGVEGRRFEARYYSNFTTPGPGTSVGNEPTEVRRRIGMSFDHTGFIEGDDYVEFWLPFMPGDTDEITYLKTFFEKEEYKVKDEMNRDEDIRIQLRMLKRVNETAGLGYNISSTYGDQEGSFLRVKYVKIDEDEESIRFDFELEFECNLYHFYQNGREGLWSKLTDGVLKAEITLEKE